MDIVINDYRLKKIADLHNRYVRSYDRILEEDWPDEYIANEVVSKLQGVRQVIEILGINDRIQDDGYMRTD